MDLIDFLGNVEIFRGLNERELTAIQPYCNQKNFRQGEQIAGENEEAANLWVVVDGQVDLRFDLPGRDTSKETTITSLSRGKSFGWSSLVPPYRYRLSSYCVSEKCQVFQIDKIRLIQLFEGDTRIGYVVMTNIAMVIGSRFHQLQDEFILREGHDIMHRAGS